MSAESRERRLVDAFVAITDTAAENFSPSRMLSTVVEVASELVAASGGVLLGIDAAGIQRVDAMTDAGAATVARVDLRERKGPCSVALRDGTVVPINDIEESVARWPLFGAAALSQGFASVHVVPLARAGEVHGALALFRPACGPLDAPDRAAVRGLADAATTSILSERSIRRSGETVAQLRRALSSRVVIEQAKGVIASSKDIDVESAFTLLRDHARSNGLNIHDVSRFVVERRLQL